MFDECKLFTDFMSVKILFLQIVVGLPLRTHYYSIDLTCLCRERQNTVNQLKEEKDLLACALSSLRSTFARLTQGQQQLLSSYLEKEKVSRLS